MGEYGRESGVELSVGTDAGKVRYFSHRKKRHQVKEEEMFGGKTDSWVHSTAGL